MMNIFSILKLKRMNGYDFEDLILKLIIALGYKVEQTKKSGDGGIDIIAYSKEPIISGKYLIQCKRYTKPIGEPVLRDLYGVITAENANKGIVITNSTFSLKAIEFAEDKQIELIDGNTLESLLKKYLFDEIDAFESLSISQEKILNKLEKSILKLENAYMNYKNELVLHKKKVKTQKEIYFYSDYKSWISGEMEKVSDIQRIIKNNFNQLRSIIESNPDRINQENLNMIMKNIDTGFKEMINHYIDISDQVTKEEFDSLHNHFKQMYELIISGYIKVKDVVAKSIKESILDERLHKLDLDDFIDSEKLDVIAEDVDREKSILDEKNQPILVKLFKKLFSEKDDKEKTV